MTRFFMTLVLVSLLASPASATTGGQRLPDPGPFDGDGPAPQAREARDSRVFPRTLEPLTRQDRSVLCIGVPPSSSKLSSTAWSSCGSGPAR
jgi:hypothetical protein